MPWGKVLELSDGFATLKVTLDIGPRIIYCAIGGGTNLMYEDIDNKITKGGEFFSKNFGDKQWRIIGGHRLWKSPEDLSCYYPDLSEVRYTVTHNTVSFFGDTESTTRIFKTISIELLGEGKFRLIHKFVNKNDYALDVGLWALTVLREGGVAYLLTNDRKEGFLPTQNFVFWPYSDYSDSRLCMYDDFVQVTQNKEMTKPFKMGAYLQKGVGAYRYKDNLLIKKIVTDSSQEDYPDMGCNYEVYTNDKMLELETLSKITTIPPKGSLEHTEIWELLTYTDASVEKLLKQYANPLD